MKTTHHEEHRPHQATIRTYVTGFVLSIVLTLTPYFLVVNKMMTASTIVAAIVGFAVVQLFVQLIYFLHLGGETRPRWNSMSFIFTAFVTLVIVVGSLWIMYHLNYNTMSQGFSGEVISPQTQVRSF